MHWCEIFQVCGTFLVASFRRIFTENFRASFSFESSFDIFFQQEAGKNVDLVSFVIVSS